MKEKKTLVLKKEIWAIKLKSNRPVQEFCSGWRTVPGMSRVTQRTNMWYYVNIPVYNTSIEGHILFLHRQNNLNIKLN